MESFGVYNPYEGYTSAQAADLRRSEAIRRAREKRKNDIERARIAAQLKIAQMEEKPALQRSKAALTQAATGAREVNLRYGPGGIAPTQNELSAKELNLRYGPGGTAVVRNRLTAEELARRYPWQAPQYNAETARMNAEAAKSRAASTAIWSKATAKRALGELGIEQSQNQSAVASPKSEADIVNEIGTKLKKKKQQPLDLGENATSSSTKEPTYVLDWLDRIFGY